MIKSKVFSVFPDTVYNIRLKMYVTFSGDADVTMLSCMVTSSLTL